MRYYAENPELSRVRTLGYGANEEVILEVTVKIIKGADTIKRNQWQLRALATKALAKRLNEDD